MKKKQLLAEPTTPGRTRMIYPIHRRNFEAKGVTSRGIREMCTGLHSEVGMLVTLIVLGLPGRRAS